MAIMDRIVTIVRANLNDLLTRAEDPEKIINQTLMDMRQAQYEARMEVAQAMAEGKRLERDLGSHQDEAKSWLEKAEQAMKSGREDLAREALRRKKAAKDLAEGFEEQLASHRAMLERLTTQMRALDAKIEEAERKRKLLIARQRRVDAQGSVDAAMAKTDTSKAFAAFERMENKVVSMEDRLEAERELSEALSLDDEFAALREDSEVEDELETLRARLGGASE
ncbi:MAG: PspA/IM30 family protein [Deinococcota bacterium]|nr:PspA/IM30 family protein [Deinococcota bacterium]